MHQSFLIVLTLCCYFGVSSCLKVETIDKALFRAQEYLKTVKEHPEKDNGNVILSSPLVVDFGNMQVEDFLMLKSYEKVMIASVHSVLNESSNIIYYELIAALNNVVLLKKPKNNGLFNEKDFWSSVKFWRTKKEEVKSHKLERLTEWFLSLIDDENIMNATKFMNSKSLNLFEMCKTSIPYLIKACRKNREKNPYHEIINLTVLQYPTLKTAQIKIYNIEISLRKICSTGQLILHGKYQSYRYEARKFIIKMMKKEIRKKIRRAMKTWIEDESVRQLFNDDFFIIENWYLGSHYNREE